jgi:hypothetical protein
LLVHEPCKATVLGAVDAFSVAKQSEYDCGEEL